MDGRGRGRGRGQDGVGKEANAHVDRIAAGGPTDAVDPDRARTRVESRDAVDARAPGSVAVGGRSKTPPAQDDVTAASGDTVGLDARIDAEGAEITDAFGGRRSHALGKARTGRVAAAEGDRPARGDDALIAVAKDVTPSGAVSVRRDQHIAAARRPGRGCRDVEVTARKETKRTGRAGGRQIGRRLQETGGPEQDLGRGGVRP